VDDGRQSRENTVRAVEQRGKKSAFASEPRRAGDKDARGDARGRLRQSLGHHRARARPATGHRLCSA
jgi:hypothetical protein